MNIHLRRATTTDAGAIGRLAAEFQAHLRAQGSLADYTWGAEAYLRDGFGPDPAFEGVVAEAEGGVVGFALYHFGYDSDRGERLLYLIDLFVSEAFRGRGIGEGLMERLAEVGRARGAELMAWSVLTENRPARRFYERVGARYVEDQYVMWRPIGAAAPPRAGTDLRSEAPPAR